MRRAMDEKLVVLPIIGSLNHTHFWEGPCRAGHREDMTPEAEKAAFDRIFAAEQARLKDMAPEIEVLPAIDARYCEDFVTPQSVFDQIDAQINRVDVLLPMGWRTPKLERYDKTFVVLQNGNEGIDFSAYCRSLGREAYVCMDRKDLDALLHLLWVRKVVRSTRALVLTAGAQPTFGI